MEKENKEEEGKGEGKEDWTELEGSLGGRSLLISSLLPHCLAYLLTPASPLDSGALLSSSPPFGGAVAAESQLGVLVSQWCVSVCVCLPDFLPPDSIGVGRLG